MAVDINELTATLNKLQSEVSKLDKMQQSIPNSQTSVSAQQMQPQTPPVSTYPRVTRTDTVEDILNNPAWKEELAYEFNASDLGTQAKNHMELLFMQFCERQTGRKSIMLDNLRQQTKEQPVPKADSTPDSNITLQKIKQGDKQSNG